MHFIMRLLFFAFCLLLSATSWAQWHIDSMVVFGDGESDNGNSLQLYGIPLAPYWRGRFSDGPVWDEYLAYEVGLIKEPPQINPDYPRNKNFLDFAVFDAMATRQHKNLPKRATSLKDEINSYEKFSPKPNPQGTLAIIYIGQNDLYLTDCVQQPLQCLNSIRNALLAGIMRLYKHDKVSHILIIGIGNVSSWPYMVLNEKNDLYRLVVLAQKHYMSLITSLALHLHISVPDLYVYFYDKTMIWEKNNYDRYHQPIQWPCYNNYQISTGKYVYNRKIATVCSNPSKYFFFDMSGYKTTSVYKKFSDNMLTVISKEAGWAYSAPHHSFWQRLFGR